MKLVFHSSITLSKSIHRTLFWQVDNREMGKDFVRPLFVSMIPFL